MVSTRNPRPGSSYERLLHEDTRKEMERLVPIVKAMTGPGTGFTLKGTTAIGPICAFIASKKLGNNDFSEESARKASCINPKTFQETLYTIRLVLDAHEKSSKRVVSYAELVKDYQFKLPDLLLSYMQRAEDALVASGQLKRQLTPPHNAVTIAVFTWVCMNLKQRIDEMELIKDFKINEKDIEQIEGAIFETCRTLAADMKRELRAILKPSGSQPATPSTRTASRSPTKSQHTITKSGGSSARTPTHKHKVAFASRTSRPREDDAMQVDGSPFKKQKTSPTKAKDNVDRNAYSAFQAELRTPARPNNSLTSILQASSSKFTLDLLNSRNDDARAGDATEDDTDGVVDDSAQVASTEVTDVEMDDEAEPSDIPETSILATPRRSSRVPRPTVRDIPQALSVRVANLPKTPTTRGHTETSPRKTPKAMSRKEEVMEEVPRERRHRPVLLGHKQWFFGDVRIEREWEMREERMRVWIESRGGSHPFGLLSVSG